MPRVLLAQYPKEEVTLRKIAHGIVRQNEICEEEFRRLQNFGFVDVDAAGPRLTPMGRREPRSQRVNRITRTRSD
jgi:Mn-dependent DtxR family transcriptional regulator